jgi:predicted nucleic acid-binding protein
MNSFFNTSPLIFLEKLKLIDRLLPKLWNKIYITKAVIQEVNDKQITDQFFFQEYNIKNKIALMSLPSSLHKGEAESIIGAIETGINFIVLDDLKARKKAGSMGVRTMGTMGVFLFSVENKIMTAEEAIINLETLRKKSFWVSDELFAEIIGQLKELRV